jgi:parvulin-like peptidyl-prolyl isomerase
MIQGAGSDFGLTNAVYNAPIGKISGPVRGETGYYIIQVNNRAVPSKQQISNEIPDYYKNLVMQSSQSSFYMWYSQMKKNAKIEDNRYNFFTDY